MRVDDVCETTSFLSLWLNDISFSYEITVYENITILNILITHTAVQIEKKHTRNEVLKWANTKKREANYWTMVYCALT